MRKIFLSVIFLMFFDGSLVRGGPITYLSRVEDVPLPGGATRFDYQSLDPDTGRLFISHMGDGELVVFDVQARRVLASLRGFPDVTGVLAVPTLHKVYASVPGAHEVVVTDGRTLKKIARIPAGEFPDGSAYDPKTRKVFVSDESGGKETVIDAMADKKVESIDMGGEVGNTQYDPGTGLVYANVQTRNEMVVIDPSTDKIISRHGLRGGDHPHGLLVDPPDRLAFCACDGNDKLLVLDLKTFRVIQIFQVGDGPDVLAYDAALKRLYVACESGIVSIFEARGKGLQKLVDAEVGTNSHTVSVDPKTHLIYFPLKNADGHPVLRIMRENIK